MTYIKGGKTLLTLLLFLSVLKDKKVTYKNIHIQMEILSKCGSNNLAYSLAKKRVVHFKGGVDR